MRQELFLQMRYEIYYYESDMTSYKLFRNYDIDRMYCGKHVVDFLSNDRAD